LDTLLIDRVTQQLRDGILRGDPAPGARLPPERALAEALGVTRVTVRSALQRLSQAGLVVSRQGSGTRVADFLRRAGPELLPDLSAVAQGADRKAFAADLLLLRRHLAAAVLERLVAVRPPLHAVIRAIDDFACVAAAGADPHALARADADILAALLAATGSPALQLTLNPIRAVLTEMPELAVAMYRDPPSHVAGWRLLIAWLSHPDGVGPGAAERALDLLAARDAATLEAW
jgi:GntR family transcriptional repressor for pyruvate dehydrogenase complex